MSRRRAAHTQADIDRALKAARKAGAREVSIEVSGVKLNFLLAGDNGEKATEKLAKRPRTLL